MGDDESYDWGDPDLLLLDDISDCVRDIDVGNCGNIQIEVNTPVDDSVINQSLCLLESMLKPWRSKQVTRFICSHAVYFSRGPRGNRA